MINIRHKISFANKLDKMFSTTVSSITGFSWSYSWHNLSKTRRIIEFISNTQREIFSKLQK